MKKLNLIFITLMLLAANQLFSQISIEKCVSCNHNTINYLNYSSAVGIQNTSNGLASFAAGKLCSATGSYSVAMGYGSTASANYSFAFGQSTIASQNYAFSLGKYSESTSAAAFSLGTYLTASDQYAMVIGKGYGYSNRLENDLQNTLMIGFNSENPTFFVGTSPNNYKTGEIGIGNITAPQAKLHVLGDSDATRPNNASLYIQSAGDYYSTLWLGDQNHYIKTKPDEDLLFNAANENFIFEGGKVGIGTNTPGEKLEVAGTIKATTFSGDGSLLTNLTGDNLGNHTATQNLNLNGQYLSGDGTNIGLFVDAEGDVGIGTNTPGEKLEVAGTIKATTFSGDGSLLTNLTGDNLGNHIMTQNLLTAGHWINGDSDENQGIYIDGLGRVGIGTGTPGTTLEVAGNIAAEAISLTGLQIVDNNQGAGKLLQSDANGNASWVEPPPADDGDWEIDGSGPSKTVFKAFGKVGIGRDDPEHKLHIEDGGLKTDYITAGDLVVIGQGYTNWGRFKTGFRSLNFGQAIFGGSPLNVWGSSYIGFNIRRDTDNLWKTEYDGASNGGAMIYGTFGGDLIFTCIGNDSNFAEHQQLSDEQIKVNTKMILRSDGLLKANEIVVKTDVWSDYVLQDDYPLPELADVAEFIIKNRHLPDVPSETEVIEEGINLGQMDAILLKKIEELTLYVIDLKKENEEMREAIEKLKK